MFAAKNFPLTNNECAVASSSNIENQQQFGKQVDILKPLYYY